jgi:hypothetical protein
MKKAIIFVLAVLVVIGISSTAYCASNELAGTTWTGYYSQLKDALTLEITDVISSVELRAVYSRIGLRVPNVVIKLQGNTVSFKVGDVDFTLSLINNSRMDGKALNPKIGWDKSIRFWKKGENNPSPLLGIWEGKWTVNNTASLGTYYTIETSVEVLYIDETAMTCLYKWGDIPEESVKAGWKYFNWETVSERKYVTHQSSDPGWEMTFLFANGDKKISAETLYKGARGATGTLRKK